MLSIMYLHMVSLLVTKMKVANLGGLPIAIIISLDDPSWANLTHKGSSMILLIPEMAGMLCTE